MKLYERELVQNRETHHRYLGIDTILPVYPKWKIRG